MKEAIQAETMKKQAIQNDPKGLIKSRLTVEVSHAQGLEFNSNC